MTIEPGYLSLTEIATYLSTPENTIREWVRTAAMPCYQPTWKLLFKPAEVDAWMSTRKRAKQRKPKTTTRSTAPVDATTVVSG